MVIDKPQGLPIDPGRGAPRAGGQESPWGANASLADWLPLLQLGKRHLPQPAHRLDTDTAGCLVLGRTKPALAALGALFAGRRAGKTYWAVVAGRPAADRGVVDRPLRKISTREAGWRMEAHAEGQPARTAWRMLGTDGARSWLELRPETGRTHQLRVHCTLLGCPILGDPFYGTAHPAGMHLLARDIALPLGPELGGPLSATAPLPASMLPAFLACGAPKSTCPPPDRVTKV